MKHLQLLSLEIQALFRQSSVYDKGWTRRQWNAKIWWYWRSR